MKKISTLCVVHRNPYILLGFKKRGFGQGRWNGFGGKLNKDESIENAALRELREEIGIELLDIRKRAIMTFEFENDPVLLEVHLFSGSAFTGEPIESEEMKPQWFKTDKIPFDQMWPDDKHWIPLFLRGKNFRGHFYFKDFDTLVRHKLEEVLNF